MNNPPVQFEILDEFKGMQSDTEVPVTDALRRQLNLLSEVTGSLTTRGGLKAVSLELLE